MIHYLRAPLALLLALPMAPLLTAETVTPESLEQEWEFHGMGSRSAQSRMFYMEEAPGSKGVMIVSPDSYSENVTVRYEIMPITAASVCVVILSASDTGESSLTMPDAYDGSMGHWINNVDNYFFAYHNAAHNRPPFLKKFPQNETIGSFGENVLQVGAFNQVEVSQEGGTLSFSVNGALLYEVTDPDPFPGGHIAFRIRGIPQQTASCFIRNVEIIEGN